MKVDHIGLAVRDLESAGSIFSLLLNLPQFGKESIQTEMVDIISFDLSGIKIELLEAKNPDSPIAKFLSGRKGGGIHHIAFRVDNLDNELKRIKEAGYRLVDGYPRKGMEGSSVAFLHPKDTLGVLIELVEKNE